MSATDDPLYLGESLGFRAWRLDPDGLLSINHDYRWGTSEHEARCLGPRRRGLGRGRRRPHPPELIPAPGCNCGIFAYRTIDMAEYYGRMLGGWVLGAVSCSGRMRVYRHGVRAQRVRVLALLLPPWGLAGEPARELEEGASRAARELGVPLFTSGQIPAFLEYCEAQEGVSPVPERERPGRLASVLPGALSLALWTLGVLVSVLALIHFVHGLSAAGAPPIAGERLTLGMTIALALLSAAAATGSCWRALRRAEEIHFSNLLERIGRIDRSQAPPALAAATRRAPYQPTR